ncbi:alpha/beta hydrolase, partial [Galactobacter sp.]|uniref:alpha/beta hydrolase n=1 Tax=Galactobacter sp. TaxID=2676125 RepID=UPI0025BA25AE
PTPTAARTAAATATGTGTGLRGHRLGSGAHRRLRARAAGVALVLSGALIATGCSSATPAPSPTGSQGTGSQAAEGGTGLKADVPEELKSFYDQDVNWSECAQLECTTIKVPLDYDDPDGETIELAMNRLPAKGSKDGSLLVNPGGPGGSGLEYVKSSAAFQFSDAVRDSYDIVGFDPRGVGQSTAVACQNGEEIDRDREDARLPTSDTDLEDMVKAGADYGKACETRSSNGLLEHLDTDSAARDLDVMRAVVGEDQLDYAGFSYGTKLGATYLRLFPARAGRIVLDGAMDPTLSMAEVGKGQAAAFEKSLDHYLQACLDGDAGDGCPFTGSVEDARKQLLDFVTGADKNPLPTSDGRKMPASDIVSALLLPLYEPSISSTFTSALRSGMEDGDGSQLLQLADLAADRSSDGSYSNTNDAFTAINCADYQHGSGSLQDIKAQAKEYTDAAPFFGRYLGYDDGCSSWPVEAVEQAADSSVKDPATAPLVVGTTGDPATPYAWSKTMQGLIPGSRLLTYEGWGHTAYGRSNSCVTDVVDTYLLKGELPKEDRTC